MNHFRFYSGFQRPEKRDMGEGDMQNIALNGRNAVECKPMMTYWWKGGICLKHQENMHLKLFGEYRDVKDTL